MLNSVNEISSCNAFVYQVTNLSEKWTLENPYFLALKALIHDNSSINLSNLRIQQEYHFIAKLIQNELNGNKAEAKTNIEEIEKMYDLFTQRMRQNEGDKLLHVFFNLNILNFLKYNLHNKLLKPDLISSFTQKYEPKNSNDSNMKRVLCLLSGKDYMEKEEINDKYDISLNLLYKRLLMSNKEKRDEILLIDYYLNQKEIEKIEVNDELSERSKGKILEIAVVIKAICGDGLYLPEIEKVQYLSNFAKRIFRERFYEMLFETFQLSIAKLTIRAWMAIGVIYLIEVTIFTLPSLFESVSLLNISINLKVILNLPHNIIIFLNGVLTVSYIYFIEYKSRKRISEESW